MELQVKSLKLKLLKKTRSTNFMQVVWQRALKAPESAGEVQVARAARRNIIDADIAERTRSGSSLTSHNLIILAIAPQTRLLLELVLASRNPGSIIATTP